MVALRASCLSSWDGSALSLLTSHLVIPDIHCHYQHHNQRAHWLARLIQDVKPDVVINIGDQFDMPSLSSYDKGQRGFVGRTYRADINSGLDFSERLFSELRKTKKKLPRFVYFEGNHEHRIERALDLSPELVGTISFNDLDLSRNYDIIVRYTGKTTPGTLNLDGITYGHYLISGVMGRPISGEHPAYSLVSKQFQSCTVGHSHLRDFCSRTNADGRNVNGLVAGCFLDYEVEWAGEAQRLWWKGVVLCHDVDNGQYEPEFISLKRLKETYEDKQ